MREAIIITAMGLAAIIVVAGVISTPYVIGSVLIQIAEEEDRRGHGDRWALGSMTLFLLGASYFIGKQLWLWS